jgi:hypothetical protein
MTLTTLPPASSSTLGSTIARVHGCERRGVEQMQTVSDYCSVLAADPIFAMSLGSKELFHSNLLGWYVERFPAVAEAVCDAWAGKGAAEQLLVQREHRHLDLVIDVPDRRRLVIENKMFALPDDDQLDRYASQNVAARGEEPTLVLLSLTDPGWVGDQHASGERTWHYRSYRELRRLLLSCVAAVSGQDAYAGETLERWCTLLHTLQEVAYALGKPEAEEPVQPTRADRRVLASIRLDGPIQKMRYQHIALQARRLVPGLTVGVNLTNGTGLAEGVCWHGNIRVGWQLQGDQWRLAMAFRDDDRYYGRENTHWENRATFAREHRDWFDFDAVRDVTGTATPERPGIGADGGFLRFNPDFVYRYLPVPGLTVADALTLAVTYGKRAIEWQQKD